MSNGTAGLTLRDAFAQAEEELALSEESPEADTSGPSSEGSGEGEQPAVENEGEVGLFDDPAVDNEGQEEQLLNEDSFEVTVEGETHNVSLDELRNGYMRQADYTRKTQQLSELEREAEKALALKEMLESRPQDTLRKLYQSINTGRLSDMLGDGQPSQKQVESDGSEDFDERVETRVREILDNDPRIKAMQNQHAIDQIEGIFAKISEDYGVQLTDSDKQRVLEKAQEQGTTDLEMVFGAMYARRLAADRRRDLEKKNARQVSSLKGEARVDTFDPQTPSSPKKYDSFRSALEEELALMEQEA